MQYFVDSQTGNATRLDGNPDRYVIVEVPDGSYSDGYWAGDYADDTLASVIPLPLAEEEPDDRKVAAGMDPQPPVTLTGHEVYYVAAMIRRGIAATRELLESQAMLAADRGTRDDVPRWAMDSLEGAHAYTRQMLNESEQFIPKGLQ